REDYGGNADTAALWADFLACVRANRRATLSTPELGAAAFTTVAMGVQSYRTGKVLFWDKERRRVVEADGPWAEQLEQKSKKRGTPNEVRGRRAGSPGSNFVPQEYQALGGTWTGDRDPAERTTSER